MIFVLLACACLQAQTSRVPQLVFDSVQPLDKSKVDLDMIQGTILPLVASLRGGIPPERIHICFNGVKFETVGITDHDPTVYMGDYPQNKFNPNDAAYTSLTHEFGHAIMDINGNMNDNIAEGMAEAIMHRVYQKWHAINPAIEPVTAAMIQDTLNNMAPDVVTGTRQFIVGWGYPYQAMSGLLEQLLRTDDDFRAVTAAFDEKKPITFQEYVACIQQALGNRIIAGKTVANYLNHTATNYRNSPDGTYLGVLVNSQDMASNHYSMSSFNSPLAEVIYVERKDGINSRKSGVVRWWVTQGDRRLTQDIAVQVGNFQDWFLTKYIPDLQSWPDGGYTLHACVDADGLCSATHFPIYRKDPEWKRGNDIFVITNGQSFDRIETDMSRFKIEPNGADVEIMPGLIRFTNAFSEPAVTAPWGRAAKFPVNDHVRSLYFLTGTDPEIISQENGASFQPGLAPGGYLTLFGNNLGGRGSLNSATMFSMGGFAATLGGQPMRLTFASGQTNLRSPDVGQWQINAQVPSSLAPGLADLAVTVKGKTVNLGPLEISEQAPAIFTFSPDVNNFPGDPPIPILTDEHYALLANPKYGQFFPYRQAEAGGIVIIWSTGGGTTDPPIDDTVFSPGGLHPLAKPVSIAVCGQAAETLYQGRAPGYGGLDQIVFRLPENIPSGSACDLQLGSRTYAGAVYVK